MCCPTRLSCDCRAAVYQRLAQPPLRSQAPQRALEAAVRRARAAAEMLVEVVAAEVVKEFGVNSIELAHLN